MQAAATLTIASVGALISGPGPPETRMSRGPWIVVARILASWHPPDTRPGRPRICWSISHVRYRGRHDEGYKGRIGNLIRDARKHRGLTQHQLADAAGHQPERDQPDREGPPEPLARDARPDRRRPRLRDRGARRRPHPPAGHRPTTPVRRHRRQDVQERRRRAAVRLAAQPGPDHAAQGRPHRGGQPAARGAQQPGCADPVAQRPTTTSRSSRPRSSTSRDRRGRRPPYPLGDHVPRPAAAPRRVLRAAVRRRLQPRHPHRRAAHGGAAAVRPRGQGHRRPVPRAGQPGHRAGPPDRAHRARRHRHRERPDGRRPAPRHHGHPQRLVQLHGPGPLLLPAASSASRSRASAPPR